MKLIERLITPLILVMTLAGCGGSGNGSNANSGTTTPATAPAPKPAVLFIGDQGNKVLAKLNTLTPAAGDLLAPQILRSNENYAYYGIAYDAARNRLYGSTGMQIAVFDNASALSGNITSTRLITPALPNATLFYDLQLDKENDRMYMVYLEGRYAYMAVYDNFSTISGSAKPTRELWGPEGYSYVVDTARSIMYSTAYTPDDLTIEVYTGVDKANGTVPAAAIVKLPLPVTSINGFAIDTARDRLYLNIRGMGLAIIDNASTALKAGTTSLPSSSVILVSLPSEAREGNIAFDASHDRIYLSQDNNVFLFNNASTLTAGSASSALKISAPAGSQINGFAF